MAGKKHEESFAQYKARLIDPISDSYCAAKWLNATIWLGNGQTTSCHHPLGHQIDAGELLTNPSAIHNTPHKKYMRKLMQEGKRPQECEYCWKIEDIGRDNMSDRVYKTAVFEEADILKTATADWQENTMLKTLEISFDRTCNFACSYCNPSFSTTWVKDIHKFGPYRNIDGDARSHFINEADHAKPLADDINPYSQAFWRWWEEGLADNLEEIRITGGEPLMAPGVWKLFEWFRNNQERATNRPDGKVLRYAINSNLVPKDDIMDKLIEYSQFVPYMEVYTSCEAFGAHAEYIRDGLDYNQWLNNVLFLLEGKFVSAVHVMCTINALCLDSLVDHLDMMLTLKQRYGRDQLNFTLNILRFPSFQSALVLPDNLRNRYRLQLEAWLFHNQDNPCLHEHEVNHVQRLIDYLDVVKTPHSEAFEMPKLLNDFKQFYTQYDQRRDKVFARAFPNLAEWYDSIQV